MPAAKSAELILKTNRQSPGVHKLIAMAQSAMARDVGFKMGMALETMRRGILYERVSDKANRLINETYF